MKRNFLILPALSLALLFGCDSDRRTAQSDGYQENGITENNETDSEFGTTTDMERTSAEGAEGLQEETVEFVNIAAASSMLEVELGQLAQEKAQSQEVKDFAQMMINDHNQANEKLQNSIQDNNIDLPQNLKEDQEDKMQNLRDLSGQEFDKEYMSMMVDMHEKDIDKFENMKEQNVQDQELQTWVDNTLTTLRQHHEQAKQIKEQLENQ
jgi:putative membrane protein